MTQYDADGEPWAGWTMHLTIEQGEVTEASESGLTSGDGACTWEPGPASVSGDQLSFSYTVAGDPDCVDNGEVVLRDTGGAIEAEVTSLMTDGGTAYADGTLAPR
ncbi:hypothetical protein ACFQXA_24920 [Nocardiopsis composta]